MDWIPIRSHSRNIQQQRQCFTAALRVWLAGQVELVRALEVLSVDSAPLLLVPPQPRASPPALPGQRAPKTRPHDVTSDLEKAGSGSSTGQVIRGIEVSLPVSGRASVSTSSLAGTSLSPSPGPRNTSNSSSFAGCRVSPRGALWVRQVTSLAEAHAPDKCGHPQIHMHEPSIYTHVHT